MEVELGGAKLFACKHQEVLLERGAEQQSAMTTDTVDGIFMTYQFMQFMWWQPT